ncbi:MAG: ATP-binding cassette domain-containing protein [Acidimicrobiales bacterium]
MTPLQPASPAAALASSGSATSPLPPDGAWGQPSPTAGRPAPVATPAEVDAPNGLVVEMRDVSKNFGRVPALSNLTILVPDGRITVLLGPNGAGKTTAIRVITGALTPDRGHVRTFGFDPDRFGEDVRRRCGVVSAKPALYDRLSGWDNLEYSAELYGLGRNAVGPIREAAGRFGILEALDQQVGGYSTGMKTRLALSRAVLHDPDLLLFDEPTSGLDPESSHAVLDLIREMTDEGRTVVMCTHLLVEAEGLADQIIVLENGTDLIHGTQEGLTRKYWPHDIVRLDAEDPSQLDQVVGMEGVIASRRENDVTEVQLDDLARVPDVVAALTAAGVRLTRVDPHNPSLEDLYFAIRRERRAPDAGPGLGAFPEVTR